MAAPSGIVWGSISGGYGRIGIYTRLSNADTKTTVSVQVWFWSKYGVYDSNNCWYFDNLPAPGSATTSQGAVFINTTVETGDGWSTDNQVQLGTFSYTYPRGNSPVTRYLYALLSAVDRVGHSMLADTTITIPALPTYTISYNANGGSGAPSSQSKAYNKALVLSSAKPTRTGYAFQGWATSASGSVAYAPGATYTANASVTLYAVWKANTYTVSYNANGGSGAPGNQTKTYGTTLTLSSTKPTRTNYDFLGWATSAAATTATYAAGGKYTANSSVTLYAVWKLAYVAPIIYNLTVTRCDSNSVPSDNGAYALVKFDWKTTKSAPGITVAWESASAASGSDVITASGTSGTYNKKVGGSLSDEATYKITVTVADSGGSNSASTTLNGTLFAFDAKAGGTGVSFGKPAELGKEESLGGSGVADFAFDAKFNQPVYGNVMGLNRLPEIPANSDVDDYMTTGSWAVYSNANAATIANLPTSTAGRFEVNSATGEGIRAQQWSYLRQKFIPYNSSNATWERDITRDESNVWTYYDWWRSTLTPEASARVYKTPTVLWSGGLYMTSGHTADLSEKISAQNNGIVIVFSQYSTQVDNSWWSSFFVPKKVIADYVTTGHCFVMAGGNFDRVAMKYLYIHDQQIKGHDNNKKEGTTNGITFNTGAFVMRYVIGV